MFWKNFYDLCLKNCTTPAKVGRTLDIANGAFTKWKNGSMPSSKNLKKLAEYFGVTVEYFFVDHSDAQLSTTDELTEYLEELKTRPEMKMLFSVAKGATKEDIEKAVAIIEALRKVENHEL